MFEGKSRKLGSTGIELSVLTMGTWGLCADSYGKVFPEQRAATLTRAVEMGIRAFDMAPTWGPEGMAERAVAEAVGTRRDEVVYITRVGHATGEYGPLPAFGADELRAQCEASLKRLATDRIDVLLLQHPTLDALRDDLVRGTLTQLVTEGKIRAWGASVSHVDDARAALVSGARVLCVPFHMLLPDLVWDLASECRERGVGLIARNVLAHGLLSGRWGEKKRFTADDHRMYRWSSDALAARIRQANTYRQRVNGDVESVFSLALQFVLAHEDVASACFGPRTPAQVVTAVEAVAKDAKLAVADLQFHYNSIR